MAKIVARREKNSSLLIAGETKRVVVDPLFARNSAANGLDGTNYIIDQPRFEAVNLLSTNHSNFEENSLIGINNNNTGTTKFIDYNEHKFGKASLKIVCDGTIGAQGIYMVYYGMPNTTYTFSVYLKGSVSVVLYINSTSKTVSLTNNWARYFVTATTSSSGSLTLIIATNNNTTFWADGLQLELGSNASPWVEGGKKSALLIEEATTNVLVNPSFESDSNSDGLADGWNSNLWVGAGSSKTLSLVPGLNDSTKKAQRMVATNLTVDGSGNRRLLLSQTFLAKASTTYTLSFYLKAVTLTNCQVSVEWSNTNGWRTIGTNLGVIGQTVRRSMSFTTNAAENIATNIWIEIQGGVDGANGEIIVDDVQVEEKLYATSFIEGTRQQDFVKIPASAFAIEKGTIEFDVAFLSGFYKVNYSSILRAETAYDVNCFSINRNNNTNKVNFCILPASGSSGGSATYAWVTSTPDFLENNWYRLAVRWNKASGAISIWQNGVKTEKTGISDTFYPLITDSEIMIGMSKYVNRPNQLLIRNFRISPIDRSDAELQNNWNQQLTPDSNTAFFAPFSGDLEQDITFRMLPSGDLEINDLIEADDPIYSRASNAILYNGTTIGNNVPRFEPINGIYKYYDSNVTKATYLTFNGIDSSINCGNSSELSLLSAITLEARVKMPTTGAGNRTIIAKGNNYAMDIEGTGKVRFFGYNGATPYGITGPSYTMTVNDDKEHHLAGVFDGTNWTVYIDGVSQATTTGAITLTSVVDNLLIGDRTSYPSNKFNGDIFEVRIWNKARTAQEIQSFKNTLLNGDEPGLIRYFVFNEGSGNVVYDLSNYKSAGTITTATWENDKNGNKIYPIIDLNPAGIDQYSPSKGTFTRNSIGLQSDGIIVGNDTPRFENSAFTPNIIPIDNRKFVGWTAYSDATITLTQNQIVPEWKTNEATRIQTSGGTNIIKYVLYLPNRAIGVSEVMSIVVKNIGSTVIKLQGANIVAMPVVQPGETKQLTISLSNANSGQYIRWYAFRAESNVNDSLDFIVWNPIVVENTGIMQGFGKGVLVEEGTTNLVLNSSFENDITNWSSLDSNWTISTAKAYIGSKSLRFYSTFAVSGESIWTNDIAVKPNTIYTLTAYVYNNMTAGNCYIDWLEIDGSSVQVVDGYGANCISTRGANKWEYRWATFTTTATTAKIRVRAVCDTGAIGEAFFDCFKLEEKAYATSYAEGARANELLTIPTYVNDPFNPTNLLSEYQSTAGDSGTQYDFSLWGTPTIAIVTNEAFQGTKSLHLQTSASGHGASTSIINVPAVIGSQYTGSFYAKGSGNINVTIHKYNSAGVYVSVNSGQWALTNSWQKYSITGVLEDTISKIQLVIRQNGTNPLDCYIDGLMIEEGNCTGSWVPGGCRRIIDATQFTWEQMVYVNDALKAKGSNNWGYVMQIPGISERGVRVYYEKENNTFILNTNDDTGSGVSNPFTITNISNGWHRLAITYDGANMHVYLDGQLAVDIVPKVPVYFNANANIGFRKDALTSEVYWGNTIHDDIRISNIVRTDFSNWNTVLPIDEYTTAKYNFEGNLFPTLNNTDSYIDWDCDYAIINNSTFSRNTNAIQSDGLVVSNNQPRYEDIGNSDHATVIEEGSTNLLLNPLNLASADGYYVPATSGAYATETTVIDASVTNSVAHLSFNRTGTTGSDQRIYTPYTTIDKTKDYAFSVDLKVVSITSAIEIWLMGSALDTYPNTQLKIFTFDGTNVVPSQTGVVVYKQVLADGFVRVGCKIPYALLTGSGSSFRIGTFNGWNNIGSWEYYYRKPQLEQKSYPTSFIDGIREKEYISIPTSSLNLSEGTVEFDFMPLPAFFTTSPWSPVYAFCEGVSDKNSITISKNNTNPSIVFAMANSSTVWAGGNWNALSSSNLSANTWYRISTVWSGSKGYMSLYINGVKQGQLTINSTNIPSLINYAHIGYYAGFTSRNTDFMVRNFRISNIARDDNELIFNGINHNFDKPDEYTTYFLSCNNNLNAVVGTPKIETNLSLNDGETWLGWKIAHRDFSIEDIISTTNLSNAKLQVRQTLNTSDSNVNLIIKNMQISVGKVGLLIEEATTNIVPTQDITSSTYTKESFGAGTITGSELAPDGTYTAYRAKLVSGSFYWRTTVLPNTTYTFSCWLKTNVTPYNNGGILIWCYNGTGGSGARAYSSDRKMTNQWKRYTVTYTTASDETSVSFAIGIYSGSYLNSQDISVWGVQVETKSYATSFITDNRNSESLTLPVSNIISPYCGTLEFITNVRDIDKIQVSGGKMLLNINRSIFNGSNQGINFLHESASAYWTIVTFNDSNSADYISVSDTKSPNGMLYVAMRWDTSTFDIFFNGIQVATKSSPKLPSEFTDFNLTPYNMVISAVRFSDQFRTNQEILETAKTKNLITDSKTTLLLPFRGSLKSELPFRVNTDGSIQGTEFIEVIELE